MIDAVRQQLADADTRPARDKRYFAGARFDDDDLRDATEDDRDRRAADRARHAEATASNLGLRHDIRAALADPTEDQLHALREIVCRLLCRHYPEVIAYGAGWTDPARQPVGDTGRHEPRHADAIISAELERALEDPDPLRGIAQLVARWGATFALDPDGVTRTKPSAPSAWRASCATPFPVATSRCAPPYGRSCAPSCRRRSPRSTATPSCPTPAANPPSTSPRTAPMPTSTQSTSATTAPRRHSPTAEKQRVVLQVSEVAHSERPREPLTALRRSRALAGLPRHRTRPRAFFYARMRIRRAFAEYLSFQQDVSAARCSVAWTLSRKAAPAAFRGGFPQRWTHRRVASRPDTRRAPLAHGASRRLDAGTSGCGWRFLHRP
jgi:hypothetical protein